MVADAVTAVVVAALHIQGHDKMRHDWRGYHMNPFSRRYDANAGQELYNNRAHGPDVW